MAKRQRGNGSVQRAGDKWRVRVWIGGKRKTIASGIPTEEEAHRLADAISTVRAQRPVHRGITLNEFVDSGYFESREALGYRSVDTDRSRYDCYVRGSFVGTVALRALQRRHVAKWRNELLMRGLKHQTVTNSLNMLRAALNEVLEQDIIETNPAREVKVPRALKEKTDELGGIMTPSEQLSLIHAVDINYRPMVAIALYTGMRQGEVYRLRWEDIGQDELLVRKAKAKRPRTLPLFPSTRAALEAVSGKRRGLLFPSTKGSVRGPGAPTNWHRWVARAEVPRRVRWHDLRHTCATALLAGWWGKRWPIEVVSQMLGHASVLTTERYARKLQESLRLAAAGVEPVLDSRVFLTQVGPKPSRAVGRKP